MTDGKESRQEDERSLNPQKPILHEEGPREATEEGCRQEGRAESFGDFLREQERITERLRRAKEAGEKERRPGPEPNHDYTSEAWRNPEGVGQADPGFEPEPSGKGRWERLWFGLDCCLGWVRHRIARLCFVGYVYFCLARYHIARLAGRRD